jgi:hypothetical protein
LRVYLLDRVAHIKDAEVRRAYEHELRKRLDETFQPRRTFTPSTSFARQPGKKSKYAPAPIGPKPTGRMANVIERRAELVLLALLNHPHLFDEFADALHDLDCAAAQRPLHQDLCAALGEGYAGPSLRAYLHERGHEAVLMDITGPRLRHMIFANPDAVPEELHAALVGLLDLGENEAIRQEIRTAARAADDEAAHRRITALHKQLHERSVGEE